MTRRASLTVLAACAWQAPAQPGETGALTGLILDDERRPVTAALVKAQHTVKGETSVATSDRAGRYRFPALAGGAYNLYFAKTGYCSVWLRQVVIRPGETTQRDTTLARDTNCRPAPSKDKQ
jgi:hypothetical protein